MITNQVELPFYKTRRDAIVSGFKRVREMESRHAVESVHVPIKLLTDKERTRLVKVETMLDGGKNPYQADEMKREGKNLGGGSETVKEIVEREPARIKVPIRLSMRPHHSEWPALDDLDLGAGPARRQFKEDLQGNLTIPVLYCSFCGIEVETHRASFGTGKLRKMVKTEITKIDDLVIWDEKVIHTTDKVIACPDHSLLINKTRFDASEG